MRIAVCAVLATMIAIPVSAGAQTQPASAPTAPPAALAPPAPLEAAPDDRAKPLAAGRDGTRIASKNEAYNLARAAEGRVGVRVGDDVSYRITGN